MSDEQHSQGEAARVEGSSSSQAPRTVTASSGRGSTSSTVREELLASRRLAYQQSQKEATSSQHHNDFHPKHQALKTSVLNTTTSLMSNTETPRYNLHGQPLPPGIGFGVAIVSAKDKAHTASGHFRSDIVFDNVGSSNSTQQQQSSSSSSSSSSASAAAIPGSAPPLVYKPNERGGNQSSNPTNAKPPKKTLSDMRFQRRMAQRADPSFDIDGDGTVSQTDFFFATRFDTSGDGHLSTQEKLDARKIMKEEEAKFLFIKGGPAETFAHRVQQKDGVVMSEQLEGGWDALNRSTKGTSSQGELPFVVQGASGALVGGTGTAGIQKANLDIDMDDSDNVALMHTKGQVFDYENVCVKPAYRVELDKSGLKSLADLRFKRKIAQRADPSFDLDGDGQVSQKDFFFATRFDKDGSGVLDPFERATAAAAMKEGFGSQLHFVRTSGPSDKHHRIQQRDGVIMSEEFRGGGYGKLAQARMDGDTARIGADGNIKDDEKKKKDPDVVGVDDKGKPVFEVSMTDEGRVALQHIDGVVYDFDQIPIKPQYRPGLLKSGSSTRSELLLRRRKEKYPDLSMDLDGDGAVSQADYWFSKRYDVDDNNTLDPVEKEKAVKDYKEGYQKRFVTISSSAGPGGAIRVHQVGDQVLSEGEGMLTGRNDQKYDKEKRLPTLGAVPGLDLPEDRMLQPGLLTKAALKQLGRLDETGGKPVAVGSVGVIQGVSRVILRHSDGTQMAYGGFASGVGANNLNNCTGTIQAATGRLVGPGSDALEPYVDREEGTFRQILTVEDGVPEPKPLHATSFALRGRPSDVWAHAPYANAGEGGTVEAHASDEELASNKNIATSETLLTRTQLIKARRLRRERDEQHGHTTGYEAKAAGHLSGIFEDAIADAKYATSSSAANTLNAGEAALRSTLNANPHCKLPLYMVTAVKAHTDLPTVPEDLPHESVKPMSLPEAVRTHEATRLSALQAVRKRDLKEHALELTRQPINSVHMPELYGAEFNDHHAHDKPLVAEGQQELSKTASQLTRRRIAERFEAALKWAPDQPQGVHGRDLPSFAEKHNAQLKPWWTDKSHLEGVRTNFEGSPISSAKRAENDADIRGVKDYIDPIPDEYNPALRHTVRDSHLNGQSHTSTGTMAETMSGIGAKAPRLMVSGAIHEVEDINALNGDPFKNRTIHPRKLDRYLRKHGLTLPENPNLIDPWEIAKQQREDPNFFIPEFHKGKPGNRSRSTLHKNLTSVNNGLPGPRPDLGRTIQGIKDGRMWTSAVTEYKQGLQSYAEHLDATGKETRPNPIELLPLYSSFTHDNVYVEPFVAEHVPYRPMDASLVKDVPPRRNSIYGRNTPLASNINEGVERKHGGTAKSDANNVVRSGAASPHRAPHATKHALHAEKPERLTSSLAALASTVAHQERATTAAPHVGGVRTRGIL